MNSRNSLPDAADLADAVDTKIRQDAMYRAALLNSLTVVIRRHAGVDQLEAIIKFTGWALGIVEHPEVGPPPRFWDNVW